MRFERLRKRLLPRLEFLYAFRANECLEKIIARIKAAENSTLPRDLAADDTLWDERDVVLITYGDQICADAWSPGDSDGQSSAAGYPSVAGKSSGEDEGPLAALEQFLAEAGLRGLINTVHLLPCFPWSSDDGFSVIDYRRIDPRLGDWADVERLGQDYHLMLDLVLNHVSRQSSWFEKYLAGREPYRRFFIEVDPSADVSQVVRPRSLSLLTEVQTAAGLRHVWTTFSDDQIDLNYSEPDVLVEMVDVLLQYLRQGARIVRLDAIAYLWKQLGTSCIHLPQTHEVVKLLRDVAETVSPGAIILTETNVPQAENFSYFGNSDEAQMVYQFSLAPLLLETLLSGDGRLLMDWLKTTPAPPPAATVLNFTASHDGVGVRPLEGIMPPERFERLLRSVEERGGRLGTRRNADGSDSVYELNISYFSALASFDGPTPQENVETQIARFLASQAVMLALRGVPAVYFHSLVATPNDTHGVLASGRARSINRRKFSLDELQQILSDVDAPPARVLAAYRHMLSVRVAQPAFHPDASQQAVDLGRSELVAFLRTTKPDFQRQQKILVIANMSPDPQVLDLPTATAFDSGTDLLAAEQSTLICAARLELRPYQVVWLEV